MAKWAEFAVTAVRYNDSGARITHVQARADDGESLGQPATHARSQVIRRLENGTTYCTAYRSNGKYTTGASVRVVTIDGEQFIRTDNNRTKKDNLGELPRF